MLFHPTSRKSFSRNTTDREKRLALILKSAVREVLISIVELSGPRMDAALNQILNMPTQLILR